MEEESNSWVFDSLVCFLNGPIWDAPIQSFIEEKSLIFEPNNEDNEDYKKIFDEFKNLVDFMLGNFMNDIGISPQQFENACYKDQHLHLEFERNLFEQIWAANDYEIFKKMMTRRNVELQLEALDLIEQKYGITPQSFIPTKKDKGESVVREIPVIIEKSNIEKAIMEEVVKNFPDEEPSTSDNGRYILEEKEILEEKLKTVKDSLILDADEKDALNVNKKETESEDKIKDKSVIQKQSIRNEEKLLMELATKKIDEVELKKRQEYLRNQRDKLVALKKEARKKHLDNKEREPKSSYQARPKSAKAAEAALSGDASSIEPQKLHLRKALADRLKSEVVDKKKN